MVLIKKKLSELVCRVYTEYTFDILSVEDTPICISYRTKSEVVYASYHTVVKEFHNVNDTHTWREFIDLAGSIVKCGYLTSTPIKIEMKNGLCEIVDGQHRAAILWELYGDIEIEVELR